MKKESGADALNRAIIVLEIQQAEKWQLLKEEMHITFENMQPFNLIKKAMRDIIDSPEIKKDMLSALIMMGAGFISKKILASRKEKPVKQLLLGFLKSGAVNIIGSGLNLLLRSKQEAEPEENKL